MPVHTDGLKCELKGGRCLYVCRKIDVMKEHWRKAHEFSAARNRGGSGMLKTEDVDRQITQKCRQVDCQRFFVQKEHSPYVKGGCNDEGEGE